MMINLGLMLKDKKKVCAEEERLGQHTWLQLLSTLGLDFPLKISQILASFNTSADEPANILNIDQISWINPTQTSLSMP